MRKFLLIIVTSLTLFSCYKDDNNYDYTFGTYIDLDELLDSTSFPRGAVGELYSYEVPGITDSLLNLFDFRWEESAVSADSLITYSTGATLSFTPETSDTYYFRLVAVSKDGGFYSTSERFSVSITSVSTAGHWMIVGEYEGETGLSLIYPNGVEEPEIIYNLTTGLPENVKDIKLGSSRSYYYTAAGEYTSFSEFSIVVEGENESVFLENDYPYDVVTTMRDNVIDPEDDFLFHTYFQCNSQSFMISKSGMFYKKTKSVSAQYNYETPYYQYPFKYEFDGVEEEVKVLDIMDEYSDLVNYNGGYVIGIILERESTGQRFLRFIEDESENFALKEYTQAIEYSGDEGNVIDLDDLGDWDLEYSYYNNAWYVYNVFKNSDGDVKVVFQLRKVSGDVKNYTTVETKTFARPDIIDESTVYIWQKIFATYGSTAVVSSNPSTSYIFLAHGNTVYKYTFSTNTVVEYYSSIPAGETITGLSMNCQQTELLVATDKGSLHLINIDRTDLILSDDEKLTYKIEGFSRVDALGYKWKSYSASIYGGYGTISSYYD